MSNLGIDIRIRQEYNLIKIYGLGAYMENEMKQMIIDALDDVNDVDLLDLVWRLLVSDSGTTAQRV